MQFSANTNIYENKFLLQGDELFFFLNPLFIVASTSWFLATKRDKLLLVQFNAKHNYNNINIYVIVNKSRVDSIVKKKKNLFYFNVFFLLFSLIILIK